MTVVVFTRIRMCVLPRISGVEYAGGMGILRNADGNLFGFSMRNP